MAWNTVAQLRMVGHEGSENLSGTTSGENPGTTAPQTRLLDPVFIGGERGPHLMARGST